MGLLFDQIIRFVAKWHLQNNSLSALLLLVSAPIQALIRDVTWRDTSLAQDVYIWKHSNFNIYCKFEEIKKNDFFFYSSHFFTGKGMALSLLNIELYN